MASGAQPARITEVAEYVGQAAVRISATQLGSKYSERRQREIVAEWVAFFATGPRTIESLEFTSRTPKRLFDALAGQLQLRSLTVKWGDYDDLAVLNGMAALASLSLGGASRVVDLAPLAGLTAVEDLMVDGLRGVVDLSPIASMTGVTALELGGVWESFKRVHVPDLQFLRRMPGLRELVLHNLIVDDADYTPLLELPNFTSVRVSKARQMRPSFEELRAQLPWSG